MRHYFQLQFKLLNRHINDFGLQPIIGLVLGLGLFVGLSFYLFSRTEFAQYIYLLAAISFIGNTSGRSRNEFLKSCFKRAHYLKLRLLENAIIALPFVLFLVYKTGYLTAGALSVGAVLLAFVSFGRGSNFTLPTPFHRWPFEFTVGFRKTFYLHLFAYFLTLMGILASNFNLGIFSLLLVFVVCLSYYSELESDYYVWVYSKKAPAFLFHKIKISLFYSSILSWPIVVSLCIFYPNNWQLIIALLGLGYIYLATFILVKYAAYPNQIGLPQSIILAVSFVLPPLLLLAIPLFYRHSTQKLSRILP